MIGGGLEHKENFDVVETSTKAEEGRVCVSDDGEDEDIQAVRRQKPTYAGIYAEGYIHGVDVTYTVDTGSTKTIMSYPTYLKIPEGKRPELVSPSKKRLLTSADGGAIIYYGKALFRMDIGPLNLEKPILVADIEDEVLLGADILQRDHEGPADILLSKNRIVLRGTSIPLKQIGIPVTARRVKAADHCVIPGMSEMVSECCVDRSGDVSEEDVCLLMEPNLVMTERCQGEENCQVKKMTLDSKRGDRNGDIQVSRQISFTDSVMKLSENLQGVYVKAEGALTRETNVRKLCAIECSVPFMLDDND